MAKTLNKWQLTLTNMNITMIPFKSLPTQKPKAKKKKNKRHSKYWLGRMRSEETRNKMRASQQARREREKIINTCGHPERDHKALQMCNPCYLKHRADTNHI